MVFLRGATAGVASHRTGIHSFRPKEGASLLHFKSETCPKGTGKCFCVQITFFNYIWNNRIPEDDLTYS